MWSSNLFLHPAVSRVFHILGFSGSWFFSVQVFQGSVFSGSRFSWAQVFMGPGFSGSMIFRIQVLGLGPGFRSNLFVSVFEKTAWKLKRLLIKELRFIDIFNSIISLKWFCQTLTLEYFQHLNNCDCHFIFRFRACFEQGVPWHSGNYRVWIHSENAYVTWQEHTAKQLSFFKTSFS